MFYEMQSKEEQLEYKNMLSLIGSLTLLFSENTCPYLSYRAHENIFCKYFHADNLARCDCSVDAKYQSTGIGLKTWVGNGNQKIAEFGRDCSVYKGLKGKKLVQKISEYRNTRLETTIESNGLKNLVYHIIKRTPYAMQILECPMEPIKLEHIKLIPNRKNSNNIYFTDGIYTYHFSISKNTLYMIFDKCKILDQIAVDIMVDPYSYLTSLASHNMQVALQPVPQKEQLCLRLYTETKKHGKMVKEKSGLNQWNGFRKSKEKKIKRDPNELYIPYPSKDRCRSTDFFPPKNVIFDLELPDGSTISAKCCQNETSKNSTTGKAIMSNPNNVLGKWLLRKVFKLPEGTVVTYEMLEKFGIDSVIFTKLDEGKYRIDFAEIGTYESLLGLD